MLQLTNCGQGQWEPILGNGDDVTINGALLSDGGKYKVQASAMGCLSAVAETDVVVNKTPAIPTITSNAPVCEGEAISLQTAAVANATYIWTNPQGITMASQTQHILASADASMEGTYTLSIEVDGCQSPQAALFVDIKAVPQKPVIAKQ